MESKTSQMNYFATILALFRLRFGLFGPQPKGPENSFLPSFATSGLKGPNDLRNRQKLEQKSAAKPVHGYCVGRICQIYSKRHTVIHQTDATMFREEKQTFRPGLPTDIPDPYAWSQTVSSHQWEHTTRRVVEKLCTK